MAKKTVSIGCYVYFDANAVLFLLVTDTGNAALAVLRTCE